MDDSKLPAPEHAKTVVSALMAAGTSSRFGATKQLYRVDGVPLVRQAMATAAAACGNDVVVVVGHDREAVFEALQASSGFVVVNEDYAAGLGSSIALATRSCDNFADAMIVMLADQPRVDAAHLRHLIDTWSGAADEIVSTAYAGTDGPPVLFGRAAFPVLRELRGDVGARAVLADPRFRVRSVPLDAAAIDIDTPDDLAAIT